MAANPGTSCPECEEPGPQTDRDVRNDLLLYTCYSEDCRVIEYDQHGGVHHSVSDPAMKADFLDDFPQDE